MKAIFDRIKNKFRRMKKDNAGVGIVEVILIMVVLIAVVMIFKTQIMSIVNSAFESITNDSGRILN